MDNEDEDEGEGEGGADIDTVVVEGGDGGDGDEDYGIEDPWDTAFEIERPRRKRRLKVSPDLLVPTRKGLGPEPNTTLPLDPIPTPEELGRFEKVGEEYRCQVCSK